MSGCSCGHHHHHHHHHDDAPQQGRELALAQPLVALSGHLTCQDPAQMFLVLDLLPQHVALSRAEPGTHARVENACQLALASRVRSPRYAHLRPILESKQDERGRRSPRFTSVTDTPTPAGYVRGAAYYGGENK